MSTPNIIGTTEPYTAANGHTMRAPIVLLKSGKEQTISAWAECVPGCEACACGEWLPDW